MLNYENELFHCLTNFVCRKFMAVIFDNSHFGSQFIAEIGISGNLLLMRRVRTYV